MVLTIILFLISLCATGALYCGLKLYQNWYWFWVIIVGIPLFYALAFGVLLFILTLIGFTFKKEEPNRPNKFAHFLTCQVANQTNIFAGAKIKKTGFDKINKNQSYMIVTNHVSNFDQMVIIAKIKNVYCITKPENKKLPLAGPFINKAGFISIDRNNNEEGMKAIYKAIDYIKEGYGSICIAPEGTRSKTLELLPFHPGCFNIAKRAEIPIMVVGLKNTNLIHKNFPKKITKVNMDILKIVNPEEFKELSTLEISNYVHKIYENYLGGK